ncbi:MAG: heme-binding protein [Mycobacterium sp.]
MSTAMIVARRTAAALFGTGAVLIAGAAAAAADTAPGCTAGDITGVESQVAAAMTGYFFTHPDVNAFFSSVQGLPKAEAFQKTKSYLAANPQTQAEINAIRGPVFDLRARCNIPTNNLIRGVL